MAAVKVSNNAYGTLLSTTSVASSTLTLQSGEGARFPSVTTASGDFFYVSLINTSNQIEIVKVTNKVSDTFTIVRAQDGTTARNYYAGTRVELRPVAALFNALPNRELLTADYQDNSVTAAKLATTGVVAGNYGGNGVNTAITVNSKGQLTAITNSFGYVQKNTFDFTSSGASQTWTKPSSAGKLVRVQLWGAGGSGAANTSGTAGGGGGGGSYVEGWYSVSDLGTTASIIVGGGGASKNTDSAGDDGENSTFVSGSISLTAYGGGGGGNASSGAGGGGGGEFGKGQNAAALTSGVIGGEIGGGIGGTGNTIPAVLANNGGNATSLFGGGGGGGGTSGASGTFCVGGKAIYGGGGGGGGYNSGTIANPSGGGSIHGGAGGAGATGTSNASNGATPGGGGGGSELTGVSGAGGNGRVIVTVW